MSARPPVKIVHPTQDTQELLITANGAAPIEGLAADGAPPVGNPILTAGSDGTNVQTITTDSSGRQVMVGAAADGAAAAGNPVLTAGSDGTNAQTLLTDASGRLNIVGAAADGAAVAGNPVLVAGTDGTNAQTISVDANGNVNVVVQAATVTWTKTVVTTASTAAGATATADTADLGAGPFYLRKVIVGAEQPFHFTVSEVVNATATVVVGRTFGTANESKVLDFERGMISVAGGNAGLDAFRVIATNNDNSKAVTFTVTFVYSN